MSALLACVFMHSVRISGAHGGQTRASVLWNQLKKVVKDHVGAGTVLTTAGPSLLLQKGGGF